MEKLKSYFLYITIFITGAVILVIEILGTRILAPFYGSTIFVWSSLISVTLGSLALGYFLGGRIADKYPKARVLYFVLFMAGVFTLLIVKFNQPLLVFTDKFGLRFGPLVAALVLFSLPLCLLSMASPFVIRLRSLALEKTGSTAGLIYGIATIGSLVGAILTGFFLIPIFSVSNIFIASAGTIVVLSIIGMFLEKRSGKIKIGMLSIFLLALLIPRVEYKDDLKHPVKIIHHEQSFYADLKIMETEGGSRCLVMDGSIQTCIYKPTGQSEARFIKEIERLSKESFYPDSKILLLGLGGGGIINAIGQDFSIDMVELDPKIAQLAEDFFGLELSEDDRLFIDDAKTFLKKTDKKYDVIISDLYIGNSMPIYMYTKEAFELIKSKLTSRGVFIINIVGRIDGSDELAFTIINTLASVFPNIIVTTNKPDQLSNVLVHCSMNTDYHPEFRDEYKEIDLVYRWASLVTDSQNPLDLLLFKSAAEFLTISKKLGGYEPLFSN